MKRFICLLSVVLLLIAAAGFVGCGAADTRPEYTVTFAGEEDAVVGEKKIRRGDSVDALAFPEKPGYAGYWTDKDGNKLIFPRIVTGDEVFYLKYSALLVENACRVEYYLESADGQFYIDDLLTETRDLPLNTKVNFYPAEIKGYVFDAENAGNVTEGFTQPGKTAVLKAYYRIKYFTLTFMADGIKTAEIEVLKNQPFPPDSIEAPEIEGKLFLYWSKEENGEEFDFGNITGNVTLFAVYKDKVNYSLDFELATDLYVALNESDDVWEEIDGFNVRELPYGYIFRFSLFVTKEAVGKPIVVLTRETDGVSKTETLSPDGKGMYSVKITGDAAIRVGGLAARQYDARFTLSENDYGNGWASPLKSGEQLYLSAEKKGIVTIHKTTPENRVASVSLTGGNYTARFCKYYNGEYLPVTGDFTFTLSGYIQQGDVYFHKDVIPLVYEMTVTGKAAYSENGDVYTSSGSFKAEFASAEFGTDDFAVTVSAEQLFNDRDKVPHGNEAEAAPHIGFYFKNILGETAAFTLYDNGSVLISAGETSVSRTALLCNAGSILGRPEWGDCYRRIKLTFVKHDGKLYVLFSGDGKAGGIYANGQEYAPTSAAEYEDYLVMYIDTETETVYFNENKANGNFESADVPAAAAVLKNISACGFTMNMKSGGKTYARLYGYGYTADSAEVEKIAAGIKTTFTVKAPQEVEITVNDSEYSGKETEVGLFGSAIIAFRLPEGKIPESFTDCGEKADYALSGDGRLIYEIFSSGKGKCHRLELKLKDGSYTSETSVFIKVKTAERFAGFGYDFSNLNCVFKNEQTGEKVNAIADSSGEVRAVLKRGEWTAYLSSGYLLSEPFTVVSGEGRILRLEAELSYSVAEKNTAVNNGGLNYSAADDALHLNASNYMQQDSIVGGVTFIPRNETLEFGYTLTGMRTCDAGTYYYPFLGMCVYDGEGGWMRYVNRENGSSVGFMLAADFDSRSIISFALNKAPFAAATGDYSWANDKAWVQNDSYEMDVKIKITGYELSVWVRTSESKKNSQEWIPVFAGSDALNVYTWYDSDEWANTAPRRNFIGTIYNQDKPCSFGITARRDRGQRDDVTFSRLWFRISERR